jgi:uncharacterized membrane protein YeaQ/YmgE (transglycosylase-associated protein family)
VLGAIVGILVSGLIVGALARFALPGRDKLSIWRTILLGILGSIVGGIAATLTGVIDFRDADELTGGEAFTGFLFQLAGAVALLVLYRRFVEKRTITGPESRY